MERAGPVSIGSTPDNWGEANDDGETLPGLEIPAGAQSIRFVAWGDVGGEVVSFASGLGMVDGFSVSIKDVVLTPDPQEYVIDLRGSEYSTIVGAFSWSAGAQEGASFSIDHIQFSDKPLGGEPPEPVPTGPPEALPVAVDAYDAASGYMGDGEMGGVTDTACEAEALEASRGTCHTFTWTPVSPDQGGKGWAGVYWQYPENNWGDDADDDGVPDVAGLALPAGAQSLRFRAWGAQGGEVLSVRHYECGWISSVVGQR